jgi:predicted nuclease with TOPRIM domain
MDKEQRSEMREMFEDILQAQTEKINGRLNVIHINLVSIDEQTKKTNGRVTVLEKDVEILQKDGITHYVNCPQVPRIGALEKSEFSRKIIYKFISVLWLATLGIIGATVAIIELVIK